MQVLAPLVAENRDASLWTSLGLLQTQAEEDREASESFAHALRLDHDNPDALLGQSLIYIRRGDLGGARRAIDTAAEEGRRRALGAAFDARLLVARARLAFENGSFDEVVRLSNQALARSANDGSAQLMLANVAIEHRDNPIEHLRAAAAGVAPPPEALGRLVPRLPAGDEACQLARRYLAIAPEGYDAPDVRSVANRCH
jgi:tetratricopeptide (TPR) repeat protein